VRELGKKLGLAACPLEEGAMEKERERVTARACRKFELDLLG
jgi:hypothetical protein